MARAKALEAAEKRRRMQALGDGGGRRLGGSFPVRPGMSPRELAAMVWSIAVKVIIAHPLSLFVRLLSGEHGMRRCVDRVRERKRRRLRRPRRALSTLRVTVIATTRSW